MSAGVSSAVMANDAVAITRCPDACTPAWSVGRIALKHAVAARAHRIIETGIHPKVHVPHHLCLKLHLSLRNLARIVDVWIVVGVGDSARALVETVVEAPVIESIIEIVESVVIKAVVESVIEIIKPVVETGLISVHSIRIIVGAYGVRSVGPLRAAGECGQ